MLTKRKKRILKEIVKEYIKKAKPVSSRILAKKIPFKLSSATIRNEMLDLAKKGLLLQPHTSAGKIPTIAGFKYFLGNFLKEREISNLEKNIFLHLKERFTEKRKRIKEIAKKLAEISQEAVIVAFSKDDFYYTGLSYLFSQPEFVNLSLIRDISKIIDHLDERMKDIFDKINETKILIGDENPFGNKCASIFVKIKINNQKIVICLLGPLRMDYSYNLSLIKFVKNIIEE